jgi:DNA-binding MarR family transcriptional regulator
VLGTIGAFRVVSESDLHDLRADSSNPRRSISPLEDEGLIRTSPLSSDDRAVVLTDRGRDLLEANRYERPERSYEPRQTFYAGLRKPRELTHDTKVYPAYQHAEERLRSQGGRVRRVVLDYELKRDYQRFLQERNRGKRDCDGRPDRQEGMGRGHWHDLRHEYASRLVERGVPLAQVRDLLGHASILTTERYDNQRLEALQAAVERLEGGKTFDPNIDASDEVSRIFQDPTKQRFAHGEVPAEESATSH